MKKSLFLFMTLMASLCSYAQKEVIIKAGTMIPIQLVNTTKAADVNEGDQISFRVSRDVTVDGVTAIPYGTSVKGTVVLSKRSSWWGTKGKLKISIKYINMSNGDVIPLDNGIAYVAGENRTPLVVGLTFLCWPCCFICGSKAEMQSGYEIVANVATNTTIKIE